MGGRQGSASPSTSGRSGREHAGAAKAAKTGVAINLAGEYPQDTRATAAAAADGNDAVAECRGSGKRVILGGNGALPTGEGTGMLPPIVSDSATSLKLRELSGELGGGGWGDGRVVVMLESFSYLLRCLLSLLWWLPPLMFPILRRCGTVDPDHQ